MLTRRNVLVAGGVTIFANVHATRARSKELNMDIKRSGSQPSRKGPPEWFTGSVRIDPLFQAPQPARAGAGERHLRARSPDGVAYPSARPDLDHHLGSRLGAA